MTLEEIFKDNPDLLNDESVIKLIDHVKTTHKRTAGIAKGYHDFHDFVLEKLIESELTLIDGKSCRDTLEEIFEKFNTL